MVSMETIRRNTEFVCCFQESVGNYKDISKALLLHSIKRILDIFQRPFELGTLLKFLCVKFGGPQCNVTLC